MLLPNFVLVLLKIILLNKRMMTLYVPFSTVYSQSKTISRNMILLKKLFSSNTIFSTSQKAFKQLTKFSINLMISKKEKKIEMFCYFYNYLDPRHETKAITCYKLTSSFLIYAFLPQLNGYKFLNVILN